MKRKMLSLLMGLTLAAGLLSGCGSTEAGGGSAEGTAKETAEAESAAPEEEESAPAGEAKTLNVAYQYGLAYAPAVLAQAQGLIESKYEELTGNTVNVEWAQMSSGADINTGIASGSIQVGFMGVGPAVQGVSKKVGYKVFTNLSGQEHGMTSNDPEIQSLGDIIGTDKQIALVNTGSIQHVILAKALAENGYGAHDLDANIVAMKHPDGKTALESGNVSCHLTSSPYIFMEKENEKLHELPEVNAAWTRDKSFIVGVASESLHDSDPDLYKAVCEAISEEIDFINNDPEAAAAITCEYDGNTPEEELSYMQNGIYSAETSGLFELATFMAEQDFLEQAIASYEDLVFDNVKGD